MKLWIFFQKLAEGTDFFQRAFYVVEPFDGQDDLFSFGSFGQFGNLFLGILLVIDPLDIGHVHATRLSAQTATFAFDFYFLVHIIDAQRTNDWKRKRLKPS